MPAPNEAGTRDRSSGHPQERPVRRRRAREEEPEDERDEYDEAEPDDDDDEAETEDEAEPDEDGEDSAAARSSEQRKRPSGKRKRHAGPAKGRADGQIGTAAAAQAALRQIAELTGKETEGVTSVSPAEDGWEVSVDVIEDRRVPSSSDLMAVYEAQLDPGGDLMSYRRVKRYVRGRGDDGGDS